MSLAQASAICSDMAVTALFATLQMPGGRRGLVAPQNTFLDSLIKRSGQLHDTW